MDAELPHASQKLWSIAAFGVYLLTLGNRNLEQEGPATYTERSLEVIDANPLAGTGSKQVTIDRLREVNLDEYAHTADGRRACVADCRRTHHWSCEYEDSGQYDNDQGNRGSPSHAGAISAISH